MGLWRGKMRQLHEEKENQLREQKERQIKTIHFLAKWLPWFSVVVIFLTTLLMILWSFFAPLR